MKTKIIPIEDRLSQPCCKCGKIQSVKYEAEDGNRFCNICVVETWRKGEFEE